MQKEGVVNLLKNWTGAVCNHLIQLVYPSEILEKERVSRLLVSQCGIEESKTMGYDRKEIQASGDRRI